MKVTLVSSTPDAAELLIFTKGTRLFDQPNRMDYIKAMEPWEKSDHLKYMANTIPSSWEFIDYVFFVQGVSRAYTHQQVRTRAGSYAQQSLRVVDKSEFDYIYPTKISDGHRKRINTLLSYIKAEYRSMVDTGMPPEDARGILPTNISTNIMCKFNLRTLSELAKSRTGGRTQTEYQNVINAMLDCVLVIHPWAADFFFTEERDYFSEIEEYAKKKFPDLIERGELLKIVDHMRKRNAKN